MRYIGTYPEERNSWHEPGYRTQEGGLHAGVVNLKKSIILEV